MKTRGLLLAALIVAGLPALSFASGEGAATFYNQGNAAFLDGRFDDAVSAYETAKDQGSHDARLLYNLGCAYWKAGELGKAIQHFEMARTRAPRDGDIQYNLDFLRAQRADELPETDQSIVVRLGEWPLRHATRRELAWAGALASLLGFFAAGAFWPRRRERFGKLGLAAAAGVVGLGLLAFVYTGWHYAEYGTPRAIVGAEELEVKSGPALSNPTLFTVHEGLDARVTQGRGTWSLIEIPTGFTGWVPSEKLLPIG
ncbi:MAG: tetratricopeptide repeat protein [Deltaproteobacteria bacterium]|nr:tetratricopeptide repeat protein [Deltaproteobacteria bacterium]